MQIEAERVEVRSLNRLHPDLLPKQSKPSPALKSLKSSTPSLHRDPEPLRIFSSQLRKATHRQQSHTQHAIVKCCRPEWAQAAAGKPPSDAIRRCPSGLQWLYRRLGWLRLDRKGQFGGGKLAVRAVPYFAARCTWGSRSRWDESSGDLSVGPWERGGQWEVV